MKITKTTDGFEFIPQTKSELRRLRWLVECIRAHPDNKVVEFGDSIVSNRFCPRCSTHDDYDDGICRNCGHVYESAPATLLIFIRNNAEEIRRVLGL